MRRFVEGTDREQSTLFPECLEDWIGEDNAVRVIDVFVDELDLSGLGFSGVGTYMILIGVRSAVAPDFRVSAATVPCAD
jgi:transposase